MLEGAISVERIRKMLGHSPGSHVTWLYAKVTFQKLSDEVKNKLLTLRNGAEAKENRTAGE
jgi:hypothetical protein